MHILYLAHRIPYPPNKGDKIRSFNEIKCLSKNHEIHLACLVDDPRDLKYEEDLKQYCKSVSVVSINPWLAKMKSICYLLSGKPLSIPYFYSFRLQKAIDELLSTMDFDVIFCFSSPMAEYLFKSKFRVSCCPTRKAQPKLIMDFVDVDSDKWAQYAKHMGIPKSWIYMIESRRLGRYERKVAENLDHSIFATDAEVKIFRDRNPHIKNISVIAQGVDLDYFSPSFSGSSLTHLQSSDPHLTPSAFNSTFKTQSSKLITEGPILIFTGAMDYYANVDGVIWFTKEILPLIKEKIPEIQFYIVGSKPAKEVLSLSVDGVKVTGYVPDTREYFSRASVAVVPLRIARGIQNKILEPMAMGIPVVATPVAFEGIRAEKDQDLLVEGDEERFAGAVVKLLKEEALRERIGSNARRAVENNHSWTQNLGKLESILEGGVI